MISLEIRWFSGFRSTGLSYGTHSPSPCYEPVITLTLPSQTGRGLSQNPGGLLPGATQMIVDEPFKR